MVIVFQPAQVRAYAKFHGKRAKNDRIDAALPFLNSTLGWDDRAWGATEHGFRLLLDRYVTGSVDRISPEAPIAVLQIMAETKMLGGAGNVAANLGALGVSTRFVSVIGSDEAGAAVLALLVEHGLADGCHVVTEPGRQTSVKTRFIAAHQQLLRADRETVAPVSAATAEAMVAATRRNLPEVGALVLSDYGKGALPPFLVPQLIAVARQAQIATLILPSDASWNDGGAVGAPLPVPAPPPIDAHAVRNAARVLREQAQRCRDILGKIAQLSSAGAPFDRMPLATLIEEAVAQARLAFLDTTGVTLAG